MGKPTRDGQAGTSVLAVPHLRALELLEGMSPRCGPRGRQAPLAHSRHCCPLRRASPCLGLGRYACCLDTITYLCQHPPDMFMGNPLPIRTDLSTRRRGWQWLGTEPGQH